MQYEITMIIAEMISSITGINGLISKSDTCLNRKVKNTAGNANPRKSDNKANILDFIYPNLKKKRSLYRDNNKPKQCTFRINKEYLTVSHYPGIENKPKTRIYKKRDNNSQYGKKITPAHYIGFFLRN